MATCYKRPLRCNISTSNNSTSSPWLQPTLSQLATSWPLKPINNNNSSSHNSLVRPVSTPPPARLPSLPPPIRTPPTIMVSSQQQHHHYITTTTTTTFTPLTRITVTIRSKKSSILNFKISRKHKKKTHAKKRKKERKKNNLADTDL